MLGEEAWERVKEESRGQIMKCLLGCAEAFGFYLKNSGKDFVAGDARAPFMFRQQSLFLYKSTTISLSDWKFARRQGSRPESLGGNTLGSSPET